MCIIRKDVRKELFSTQKIIIHVIGKIFNISMLDEYIYVSLKLKVTDYLTLLKMETMLS